MKKTGELKGLLTNEVPELYCLEGLGDFCQLNLPKTGENTKKWLLTTHTNLSALPSFIGSHVVDGASNAQSSVEVLSWKTVENRPQTINSGTCISHSTVTAANIGVGTSSHKHNMNPQSGKILKMA